MCLLTTGIPLSWEEVMPHVEYIKEHGVIQFINLYHKQKDRPDEILKWGNELEYTLVKFDHENKKVRVCICADKLLPPLQAREKLYKLTPELSPSAWTPEYNGYMIESTPGAPYIGALECFNEVEENMKYRRLEATRFLNNDESILSMNFPSLGGRDFTDPPTKPRPYDENGVGRSIFFADEVVSSHPRFLNLARNIKTRRGEKVAINIPIFKDKNTPTPFIEKFDFPDAESNKNALPDHIYMDHTGLGSGVCALQVTFQAKNVDEARWIYDQMLPITPILVTLSAATPIVRSYLADLDSRILADHQGGDDRTPAERGLEPGPDGTFEAKRSRSDPINCYIHPSSAAYNDMPIQYDQKLYSQLLGGMDDHLARHIAQLFITDPLQVYEDKIHLDDAKSTWHFDTLLSENWNNMRFKPPPLDNPNIGWRIEVRPTEVQLTDFENAAFCCFIMLLSRTILHFKLNLIHHISVVVKNFKNSMLRDAVLNQKFEFRTNITESGPSEAKEMTVNEIINGDGKSFPGLIQLIRKYLDDQNLTSKTRSNIDGYLTFLSKRASGEIWTLAHWMRHFVQKHADYKQDSFIPETIVYDMIKILDEISKGKRHDEKLLGELKPKVEKSKKLEEILLEEEEDLFMDLPFTQSIQQALKLVISKKLDEEDDDELLIGSPFSKSQQAAFNCIINRKRDLIKN